VTGKESRDLAGKCVLVDFGIIDLKLAISEITHDLNAKLENKGRRV
jgi:hypothetical protein